MSRQSGILHAPIVDDSSPTTTSNETPRQAELIQSKTSILDNKQLKRAKDELNSVLLLDDANTPQVPLSKRFIVSSSFIEKWLVFAYHNSGLPPQRCDNTSLLVWDKATGKFNGKEGLQYETHYRHVNADTWETYIRFYPQSGPAISVEYENVKDPSKWFIVNARTATDIMRLKRRESKKRMKAIKAKEKWGLLANFAAFIRTPSFLKRKKTATGPIFRTKTLQASTCDSDCMVFNVDTSLILDLVLMLTTETKIEDLLVDMDKDVNVEEECEKSGQKTKTTTTKRGVTNLKPNYSNIYVISTSWIKAFVNYTLGISKTFPGSLDNVVLLDEKETLMGPTWVQSESSLSDNSLYCVRNKACWDALLRTLPESGPSIMLHGSSNNGKGLSWMVDERWLLRKFVGIKRMASFASEDDAFESEQAVATFFLNPISEKALQEKQAEDAKLEVEQKVEESLITASVFAKDLETRRKTMADTLQMEVDQNVMAEMMMLLTRDTRPSISFIATQEERENDASLRITDFMKLSTLRLKRVKAKKAAMEAYEIWAATKFQNLWRRKKAKAKISEIKKQREKIKKEMSALKVEGVWRKHIAKKVLRKKREQKQLEEMTKGANTITKVWRGRTARNDYLEKKSAIKKLGKWGKRFIDMKKANKMRRGVDYIPFKVKVISLQGLRLHGSDSNGDEVARSSTVAGRFSIGGLLTRKPSTISSPPSSGETKSPIDAAMENKLNPRIYVSGFGGKTMSACCLTKTSSRKKTSSPIYDEDIVLCGNGLDGFGTVCITALNHSKIGNHGFLGQAIIDLSSTLTDSYFGVGSDKGVLLENVELKRLKFPIPDYSGTGVQKLDYTEHPGAGFVTLEFLPLNPATNVCGWLSVSTRTSKAGVLMGMIGSSPKKDSDDNDSSVGPEKWEMKFCVLRDGVLSMHTNPFRLNDSLLTITADEVEKYSEVMKESESSIMRKRTITKVSSPSNADISVTEDGIDVNAAVASSSVKEMNIYMIGKKLPVKLKVTSLNNNGMASVKTAKANESQWSFKLERAFSKKV